MRAQQDFHSRTVRDLLRDLDQFHGAHGRVGDLSQYVRAQGEGMFDVLASDESATAGEMLTAAAFARHPRGGQPVLQADLRGHRQQRAGARTGRPRSTRPTSSWSRCRPATTRPRRPRGCSTTWSRPAGTGWSARPSRWCRCRRAASELDLPPIERHFAARTRAVLLAPYERLIDSGEPIRYGQLSRRHPRRLAEDRRRRGRRALDAEAVSRVSASAAAGSQSRRNWAQRAASSASPIASAARASTCRQRRKPRLGSCDHGTGPCPFQPLRRSWSSPRW